MADLQFDSEDVLKAGAPEQSKLLAQGVQCGDYFLAFSFGWARQIIEQIELVPVPRAPPWMLGAVNVNGQIVPVVDIANYFSQSASPAQLQRGQRLLMGGLQAEDADNALAIVFSQTPTQLEYYPQPITGFGDLPARLQEVCMATATDDQSRAYIEIDPDKLMSAMSAELSII